MPHRTGVSGKTLVPDISKGVAALAKGFGIRKKKQAKEALAKREAELAKKALGNRKRKTTTGAPSAISRKRKKIGKR